MSDPSDDPTQADPQADPQAESEADAHVRALLAELGSGPDGDPLPPPVAARLDDTLARLVAEREQESAAADHSSGAVAAHERTDRGTVVPLRRRWSPRLATAAAAVIVLGAGGVAASTLGVLGGSDSASSESSITAESGGESGDDSGGDSDSGADSKSGRLSQDSSGDSAPEQRPPAGADTALGARPEISSATFAAQVTTLLGRSPRSTPDRSTLQALVSCSGPRDTGAAVPTAIRLDGRPAVLLVHPERSGKRLVEAWTCAGDRRLTSAVVPSR